MEIGYFAELLDPSNKPSPSRWQKLLAEDLRRPRLLISWYIATRARLRRNYLLLLYFVTGIWITKLFIHPGSPHNVDEFMARLAVGDFIPTWFVA